MNHMDKNSVEVVGRPLRYSAEDLLRRYQTDMDRLLYTMSTNSCGSYAIVDTRSDKSLIITSPGYQNGYFDKQTGTFSETLGSILDNRNGVELNNSGLAAYLGYWGHGPYMHPVETPIVDVRQIRGGQVTAIDTEGEITTQKSYLEHALPKSPGFAAGLEESIDALDGDTVTLMFSGGKDSTAIYLALREFYPEDNIIPVTVDRHRNAPLEDPLQVSESLNFDLEITPDPLMWGDSTEFIDHLSQSMSEQIVDTNPYLALTPDLIGNSVVAGHNVDAMLTIDMPKTPPMSLLSRILNTDNYSLPVAAGGHVTSTLVDYYLPRFHFWQQYAEHNTLRKLYLQTVPRLLNAVDLEERTGGKISNPVADLMTDGYVDPTQTGILLSLLTYTLPSHISPTDGLTRTDVADELTRLRSWWSDWEVSVGEELKLAEYYGYASNTNQLVNVPNMHGATVDLPTMWGPLTRTFFEPIKLQDIAYPKSPVREYIKQKTGRTYEKLKNGSVDSHDRDYAYNPALPELIRQNYSKIRSENSIVRELAPTPELETIIKNIQQLYDSGFGLDSKEGFKSSREHTWRVLRLLNLELLIQN